MTTPSVTSGPEKDKGYWQAIANYNYAMERFTANIGFDEAGLQAAMEIFELGPDHPVHGQFFRDLAEITEVIETTYKVPFEEISADIDSLSDAQDILTDLHDIGDDYE